MTDLVTWLRMQLDVDHEAAQVADALTRSPWVSQVTRDATGYSEGKIVDGDSFTVVHVEDQTPERALAEHIARWDPARVLAEVDAKRRILAKHSPDRHGYCPTCDDNTVEAPCHTVRCLALPYVDQAGFVDEWRPASARS